MSLGYADRLKKRKNLGELGAEEYHHSVEDVVAKVDQLAAWVQEGRSIFAFTGAGISTAIGIPDFRSPTGIWTLKDKKLQVPDMLTTFTHARPSFTHMALVALLRAGKVSYMCSQNVDSLHLRSGVPRQHIAELHGNQFCERCPRCKAEYVRDFEMETVGFKITGRRCGADGCQGRLKDNILDWDSKLPDDELDESIDQAKKAGIALCLGTSLQIEPANKIPLRTSKAGGKVVIVNLQQTPLNDHAALVIHARVDAVMALLMERLHMQVPPYVRTDEVLVSHECAMDVDVDPPATASGTGKGRPASAIQQSTNSWGFTLHVSSIHGAACPTPMIESVTLHCDGDAPSPSSNGGGDPSPSAGGSVSSSSTEAPHTFTRRGLPLGCAAARCEVLLRLVRWADEDKRLMRILYTVPRPALAEGEDAPDAAEAELPLRSSPVGCVDACLCGPAPADQGDGEEGEMGEGGSSSRGASAGVRYSFISQRTEYDSGAISRAYLASPGVAKPPPAEGGGLSAKARRHSGAAQDSGSNDDGSGSSSSDEQVAQQHTTRSGRVSKLPRRH